MATRKRRRARQVEPPEVDPDFVERLEQAKAASVAQLLLKCARMLNEQAVERIPVPDGSPRLRAAHTGLFPHIDHQGTRLTELARRMGISKQAVGQLVDELEQMGVLERVADPTDGRAKLIKFSSAPGRSLLDGLAQLRAFELELGEEIGDARMVALHDGLSALLAVLERRQELS